jgi:creatinine amidohydrolase
MLAREVVVVPPINHGYSPHHSDFPGVITISAETFIRYVVDVCKSLAHQGFKRILLVNGHGSNDPLLKVAARQPVLDYPDVLCAAISHWDFQPLIELAEQIRETELGGMAHACELETSMYLAIREELVQMDKAVRDMDKLDTSKYFWLDLVGRGEGRPVGMMPYWSSISETGVLGDPTKATKEKGERLLSAAIDGLVEFVRIFKERELQPRVDHIW